MTTPNERFWRGDLSDSERTALGAAWLDSVKPGWAELINFKTLSMWDGDACILGQVFAEEAHAADSRGYDWVWDNPQFTDITTSADIIVHGFCPYGDVPVHELAGWWGVRVYERTSADARG